MHIDVQPADNHGAGLGPVPLPPKRTILTDQAAEEVVDTYTELPATRTLKEVPANLAFAFFKRFKPHSMRGRQVGTTYWPYRQLQELTVSSVQDLCKGSKRLLEG